MDESQDLSPRDQDDLAGDALEAVGVGEPTERIIEEAEEKGVPHMQGDGNSGKEINLPEGVKSRLGRQEKRHQREMRQMREEIQSLQQMLGQNQNPNSMQEQSYGAPSAEVDEQIHRAVSLALKAQDEQKRKAKEREDMEHVNRRYQSLHGDLDKASDKYEDFDDVVRAQDAPFTPAMRDAALLIDNPAEVLYTLGKDKEKLNQIAKLPPIDQAREMVKLSYALRQGSKGESKQEAHRPISQVKSYPVNSTSVNDKTPVGELRRRMKAGEFKSHRG